MMRKALLLLVTLFYILHAEWRLGIDGANPQFASIISEIGNSVSGINLVKWEDIEPEPPDSSHYYDFELLDSLVCTFQTYGLELQINIKCISPWGCAGYDTGTGEHSYPPADSFWDDYGRFVASLVERYDGDGYNDMPGLIIPIRYYQIESEAGHFFRGTAEEYVRLLETAYQHAKSADSNVVIMCAGWNPGDLFVDDPPEDVINDRIHSSPYIQHRFEFIRYILQFGKDFFDVLTIHPSAHYTGIVPAVRYFRNLMSEFGYSKPIWADDMASGFLEFHFFMPEPIPSDAEQIHSILSDPSDSRYDSVLSYYFALQSEFLIKRLSLAFAGGMEKVFVSTDVDWNYYYIDGWRHQGMIYINPVEPSEFYQKPCFYSYQIFANMCEDFANVEDLSQPERGLYIIRFEFAASSPLEVMWSDSGDTFISPDFGYPLRVKHIVTQLDEYYNPVIPPDDTIYSGYILLTSQPIFMTSLTAVNVEKYKHSTNQERIKVYPQPFTDYCTIFSDISLANYLNIYDLSGNIVARFEIPPRTPFKWSPPASLPAGTYIFNLAGHSKIIYYLR